MTVYCLGSINIDNFYRLANLPTAGETLAATGFSRGLGGKGINQSIAALRAGVEVVHIGAIGRDDAWIEGELTRHGVAMGAISRVEVATGHAIVAIDDAGENQIIIHSGANNAQSSEMIRFTLSGAKAGDILLLQNETSHQVEAAKLAHAAGMQVFYSAAPFALEPLRAVLPYVTHLLLNEGEGAELVAATGVPLDQQPVQAVIMTRGAQGADWIERGKAPQHTPPIKVQPVDTTGAGDCFAGSLAAALDTGADPAAAMRYAAAAAALQVTRAGTADAMPSRKDVENFMNNS
ncbi:ribokinase [Pararhodobacter oceanensis]|uniref:ribokinase n=1 Tax=Pararhodobacter oceanensis TaxID=2172121 RepID=UPI003A8E35BE